MNYKSIQIHMVEEFFSSNANIILRISQFIGLQLIPFVIYFIIELNLVSSYFDRFHQEIVLLILIDSRYNCQVDSQFDMMDLCFPLPLLLYII